MDPEKLKSQRLKAGFNQNEAAARLGLSQSYLSQLENGTRKPSQQLLKRALNVYGNLPSEQADDLQSALAALGYSKFPHARAPGRCNPAQVVLHALAKDGLDTRILEALPWVLANYPKLNWPQLRDGAKLHNAQNRLGYLLHLAKAKISDPQTAALLAQREEELEQARLANEGTLCFDSMPPARREWMRTHRTKAAAHWNLLTALTPDQLSYE